LVLATGWTANSKEADDLLADAIGIEHAAIVAIAVAVARCAP
jgi:hypothetical protein